LKSLPNLTFEHFFLISDDDLPDVLETSVLHDEMFAPMLEVSGYFCDI